MVEPSGYSPFLCYVLEDEKMEVDPSVLETQRIECVRTYSKLLSQIKTKIQSGVYTLDKWRRVLAMKRNKNQIKDKKTAKGKDKLKLSTIVGKILDSKTGDDFILPSDDSQEQNDDNYDVYK